MTTEDGEDVQRAEKVTLKRKLTGPPRLLLGKTRTRSVGEDRPEARTNKDRMENRESSPKYSAAAESDTAELTETANMDEVVSSVVNIKSSGGRCGAAGEEDDIRNRKANRRRWWRRFSPADVRKRKQKTDVKKGLGKQESDSSVLPEGALQDTDAASLNNTEENTEKVSEGKRSFNVRSWPVFKRFLTFSDVHPTHELKRDFVEKDGNKPSTTFRKKLRKFFTRGGKRRLSGVPLENMEDSMRCEVALCSSQAQVDEPTELHSDVTVGCLEVVTAEMSIQLTKEPAESPDETPTEEQLVCDISVTKEDLTDVADGSDTIQTDSEVVEGPTDTNKDLKEVVSSEAEVLLDADQLSAWTTSSQGASDLHCEEKMDETTSQSLQPSTNGPSIRIELVPPDDITQEDEEEECWGNQNHLLLLLGLEHSERHLVQMARSLVRAAMNAAVDQLTREQQSDSDCVHREPPGCRDHA